MLGPMYLLEEQAGLLCRPLVGPVPSAKSRRRRSVASPTDVARAAPTIDLMLDAACTVSDTRRTLSTSAPAVAPTPTGDLPAESMSAGADSCNWRTLALALGSLLA